MGESYDYYVTRCKQTLAKYKKKNTVKTIYTLRTLRIYCDLPREYVDYG